MPLFRIPRIFPLDISAITCSIGQPPVDATRVAWRGGRPSSENGRSLPSAMSDLRDQSQLCFLNGFRNRVAFPYGSESALGRKSHLLAREKSRGLVDPFGNFFHGLQLGALGQIRPSTTNLSLGASRSGSKEPDRQSSYSSRKRSNLRVRENTCRAIGS